MNFLCASCTLDGGIICNFNWLQYFDVVITGRSCSFFIICTFELVSTKLNMILVLRFGFINIYSTCYVLYRSIYDIEDESIHTVQNLASSMKTTVPIFLRLNVSLECSSILTMALLFLRLGEICYSHVVFTQYYGFF